MVTVRSVTALMSTPASSEASRVPAAVRSRHLRSPAQKVRGRSVRMRLTTPITLAPGWRWMFRMTAGVRFCSAPSWAFSTPCTTWATSARNTGAPFL